MGNWISKDGVWKPATERVALHDQHGDPHIYEGPDRSASDYLKETGQEFLGTPFYEDPEIIERAHERKQTIDEFCKTKIYTKEKREAEFKKHEAERINHKAPERKAAQKQTQTGGNNTAGSGHLEGGFGDESDPKAEAIAKSKAK